MYFLKKKRKDVLCDVRRCLHLVAKICSFIWQKYTLKFSSIHAFHVGTGGGELPSPLIRAYILCDEKQKWSQYYDWISDPKIHICICYDSRDN